MMNVKQRPRGPLGGEKGMVLVLGLLLVSVLALAGTTAVMTSTTDMKINSNYTTGAQAHYIAEAGIERARAQLMTLGSTTLSQALAAVRGANNQLSDSTNVANFFANGAFVSDDVPYIAQTSFGGGTYRVYLTNDAMETGGVTSAVDTNSQVTLTSFGQGPNHSLAVIQVVVKTLPPLPGAIVLPGPDVSFNGSPSNAADILGEEKSAVALTTDVARESVIANLTAIGRLDKYVCLNPPCINNVASTIDPDLNTVKGIESLYRGLMSMADLVTGTTIGATATTTTLTAEQTGTTSNRKIVVVNGNAVLSGISGAGVLIVTGQLTMSNIAGYNGLIMCIGQGSLSRTGGSSGDIRGVLLIAKTRDASNNLLATLGNPTYNVSGGGNMETRYQGSEIDGVRPFIKKSWRKFF